jgi:hypothetical protein
MSDDIIYKGRFIWNRNKAEANERKHLGMTFEKGAETYDDPLAVEEYDEAAAHWCLLPLFPSAVMRNSYAIGGVGYNKE